MSEFWNYFWLHSSQSTFVISHLIFDRCYIILFVLLFSLDLLVALKQLFTQNTSFHVVAGLCLLNLWHYEKILWGTFMVYGLAQTILVWGKVWIFTSSTFIMTWMPLDAPCDHSIFPLSKKFSLECSLSNY